ncbi:hypothetical protein [Secundilactobacillus paracollinoides]|uniref:hypothetical protein n=1 Tax=Secundilactobacillus paracollinoides TaxID=240427 RepID=UPI00081BE479|nr:hypothetical protein [Secundilactobacillus paracollinoides]
MRSRQVKSRKRRCPVVVTIIIAILLIIIICGALFFTQINNAMRSATGKDTPADTVVKNELVKKIEASKTGNAQTDAAIDKAATTLKQTKMSTIMKAAKNQNQASALLDKTTDLTAAQSKAATTVVFHNAAYSKLRTAIADGNWVAAYNQYKTLSTNGNFSTLEGELN